VNYDLLLDGQQERNAQVITAIYVTNVTDPAGNFSNSVSASMAMLLGDVNDGRQVDAADVSPVRQQTLHSGTPLTPEETLAPVPASMPPIFPSLCNKR